MICFCLSCVTAYFLHILIDTGDSLSFSKSCPRRCNVVSCGLVCLFLMVNEVEPVLMDLLVICTSFLETYIFRYFGHF